MPVFKIHHLTKYEYDRQIQESMNEIKIFPFLSQDLEVLKHELNISGNPELHTFIDYWGNKTGNFNLMPPHRELIIDSHLIVRTKNSSDLRMNFVSSFDDLKEEIEGNLFLLELVRPDFIQSQDRIIEMTRIVRCPDNYVANTISNCSDYIFKQFSYIKGITNADTKVDEILEHHSGVCQDFAHIMLQVLRSLNIPSRYVSGYICPYTRGLRGEGATHAWVEAWIPRFGWAGIDPTNNIWVTNTHVKLAVGRDFADCSPVKGSFRGYAKQHLTVFVSVDYEDGQYYNQINDVEMITGNSMSNSPLFSPSAQQ